MSGYMSGVTKKGIDLVSRITGLLNQLTAEDFEDTYVNLRVSIVEDDDREVGFWSNEYNFGNWAFFSGSRQDFSGSRNPEPLSVEELIKAIDDERPNNRTADIHDSELQALAVMTLLKEKKLL